MIRLIDRALLDEVSAEAGNSPRLRKNHNFHLADDSTAHRLLNAIEPGSYVAPHRHLDPNKDETFVVLRGKFGLLIFDGTGTVTRTQVIEAGGDIVGVDIPHGTWHSVVSLEAGSVFLEAKAGPYLLFLPAEKAPWAPLENEPGARDFLAEMEALFS